MNINIKRIKEYIETHTNQTSDYLLSVLKKIKSKQTIGLITMIIAGSVSLASCATGGINNPYGNNASGDFSRIDDTSYEENSSGFIDTSYEPVSEHEDIEPSRDTVSEEVSLSPAPGHLGEETSLEDNKQAEALKKQQEALRKQQEEALRKQQAETLKKQQEEALRRQLAEEAKKKAEEEARKKAEQSQGLDDEKSLDNTSQEESQAEQSRGDVGAEPTTDKPGSSTVTENEYNPVNLLIALQTKMKSYYDANRVDADYIPTINNIKSIEASNNYFIVGYTGTYASIAKNYYFETKFITTSTSLVNSIDNTTEAGRLNTFKIAEGLINNTSTGMIVTENSVVVNGVSSNAIKNALKVTDNSEYMLTYKSSKPVVSQKGHYEYELFIKSIGNEDINVTLISTKSLSVTKLADAISNYINNGVLADGIDISINGKSAEVIADNGLTIG